MAAKANSEAKMVADPDYRFVLEFFRLVMEGQYKDQTKKILRQIKPCLNMKQLKAVAVRWYWYVYKDTGDGKD